VQRSAANEQDPLNIRLSVVLIGALDTLVPHFSARFSLSDVLNQSASTRVYSLHGGGGTS
jgi:hypothetical protein